MKLFDAHNHIQDERLQPHIDEVMQRAVSAGVVKMGVKGCCEADWPRVAVLYENSCRLNNCGLNDVPGVDEEKQCASGHWVNVYPSFGLHPWFISERSDVWLETLESLLMNYPGSGVGEIGIDHAIVDRDDADQEKVFLEQLELARGLERPVSIHCRRAWGRLIELLDQFGDLPRGMMIHCFGGSAEVAGELVKRGAWISFSGSITRPNAKKAGPAIRAVPDERILIETDAPDLLPSQAEGPLNEPANVRFVLEKASELRRMPSADLAELTFRNAERFFSF